MFKEFKAFAMRGNVVDMAVGIIIGAAFSKIVASFVNDVLMPPIGQLLGGMNFSNLYFTLSGTSYPSLESAQQAGAAVILYGKFIQTCVDFFIIAFAIFMAVKGINALAKKAKEAPAAAPEPSQEVLLLKEIRDSLKK